MRHLANVCSGLMLAAGTWIIRGTLFLPNGGIIQLHGGVQEILFLEVALTESWIICERFSEVVGPC